MTPSPDPYGPVPGHGVPCMEVEAEGEVDEVDLPVDEEVGAVEEDRNDAVAVDEPTQAQDVPVPFPSTRRR